LTDSTIILARLQRWTAGVSACDRGPFRLGEIGAGTGAGQEVRSSVCREEDSLEICPEPFGIGGLGPEADVAVWTGEVKTRCTRAESMMKGTVDVPDHPAIPGRRPRPARHGDHDLWLDPRASAVADLPRQGTEVFVNIRGGLVSLEE
jgi:hypothetical protein